MLNKKYFKERLVSLVTLASLIGTAEGVLGGKTITTFEDILHVEGLYKTVPSLKDKRSHLTYKKLSAVAPKSAPDNVPLASQSVTVLSPLETLDNGPFASTCFFINYKGLTNLTRTSKTMRAKVDKFYDVYKSGILPLLNSMHPLRQQIVPGFLNPFTYTHLYCLNQSRTHPKLVEVLNRALEEKGFLIAEAGTRLNYTLGRSFRKVTLRDSLTPERARPLYQLAFGYDLPQENQANFIHHLAALLPQIAIYVRDEQTQANGVATFYEQYGRLLTEHLQTSTAELPCFSFDHPEAMKQARMKLRTPHNIVVHRFDLDNPRLGAILAEDHPHTVTICFDVANYWRHQFPHPQHLKRVRPIDFMQGIANIGEDFLSDCGVTHFDSRGLPSVESIGRSFLSYNGDLTSIDISGFSNVEVIRDYFFFNCLLMNGYQVENDILDQNPEIMRFDPFARYQMSMWEQKPKLFADELKLSETNRKLFNKTFSFGWDVNPNWRK